MVPGTNFVVIFMVALAMDAHGKQKSKMPGVATIVPTVTHKGGILSNSTKGRLSDPIK